MKPSQYSVYSNHSIHPATQNQFEDFAENHFTATALRDNIKEKAWTHLQEQGQFFVTHFESQNRCNHFIDAHLNTFQGYAPISPPTGSKNPARYYLQMQAFWDLSTAASRSLHYVVEVRGKKIGDKKTEIIESVIFFNDEDGFIKAVEHFEKWKNQLTKELG